MSKKSINDPRYIVMGVSLFVAFIMLVGKMYAWQITGSTAILSDALESVVHLFATGMAGFSLWYADRPADKEHPYGYGKIAYFSAGFEGSLISIAGVAILFTATKALIFGVSPNALDQGLIIIVSLTIINLVLGMSLVKIGKKHNSLVLIANGKHVLTDMWTSLGVLVGVFIVWLTNIVWLDPVVALLAGAQILWSAGQLIRESYNGLMEKADPETLKTITNKLNLIKNEGTISDFHELRLRQVNNKLWIEIHLLFNGKIDLTEAHKHASFVENQIEALFPDDDVYITSHLEPDEHEIAHPEGHSIS